VPTRLLDEAIGYGEAEAREEWIERARQHGRGHPYAGVDDGKSHVVTGRHGVGEHVPRRPTRIGRHDVGGLDQQVAAVGHGVARVDDEVEQRALKLVRVAQRRPQALHKPGFNLDRRADGTAEQVFHAADQQVHVGGLGIECLPPREGEQPLGERRG